MVTYKQYQDALDAHDWLFSSAYIIHVGAVCQPCQVIRDFEPQHWIVRLIQKVRYWRTK